MKTVYIIEDDAATMRLYHYHFKQMPWVVRGHMSVESALEDLKDIPSDLFLLDLDLLGCRGESLIEILRGHSPYKHTPILVVSAQDSSQVRLRLMDAGATELIPKPFSPTFLKSRMVSYLNDKET